MKIRLQKTKRRVVKSTLSRFGAKRPGTPEAGAGTVGGYETERQVGDAGFLTLM